MDVSDPQTLGSGNPLQTNVVVVAVVVVDVSVLVVVDVTVSVVVVFVDVVVTDVVLVVVMHELQLAGHTFRAISPISPS